MIGRLRELFSPGEAPTKELESPGDRLRLATCVVLLEAARANERFSPEERSKVVEALRNRFELAESEAAELIELATQVRQDSSDLWKFTNKINQSSTLDEKKEIIHEAWRIVYADGSLEGGEDYLMHQLAELLNLNHRQLIDAKLDVLAEYRETGR